MNNKLLEIKAAATAAITALGAIPGVAWVKAQPEIRYAYAINNNYVHMDIGR